MSSFWNSPAWSMAKRSQSAQVKKQKITSPGPGNYNTFTNIADKKHGWKMGTSNRNKQTLNQVPGPGKYDYLNAKYGPKISMGIKPKITTKDQNIPGPGNYNLNDDGIIKTHTGFTMGVKYGQNKIQDSQPGPGSYNLQNNKKSGVKIGTSKRANEKFKQTIPGPGTYNGSQRPQSAGPLFSFGGGSKNNLMKTNQFIPGPGHYNYQSSISQIKGITLGQKSNQNLALLSNVPGPGQYQSLVRRPSSGTKIGRAERNLVSTSFAPGPGAYDFSSYSKTKGAVKIGTGSRHQVDKSNTPGPGAYQFIRSSKEGITISGIKNKKNIQITPGPGAYNADGQGVIKRPCSAKIGTGGRSKVSCLDTPGPGSYNLGIHDDCKFAYSKEIRSKESNQNEPGPGQYSIPATIPSVPYYQLTGSKFSSSNFTKNR